MLSLKHNHIVRTYTRKSTSLPIVGLPARSHKIDCSFLANCHRTRVDYQIYIAMWMPIISQRNEEQNLKKQKIEQTHQITFNWCTNWTYRYDFGPCNINSVSIERIGISSFLKNEKKNVSKQKKTNVFRLPFCYA